MSSDIEFSRSIVIQEPSEEAQRNLIPLAILVCGNDILVYYWRGERHRKVFLWAQRYDLWLQQNDMKIRESISDVLGCDSRTLEIGNMMLFDGPMYNYCVQMPTKLEELFLDCEWSDYACDRMPVSGRVSIRIDSARSTAPMSNADSLNDDEISSLPRRWRR